MLKLFGSSSPGCVSMSLPSSSSSCHCSPNGSGRSSSLLTSTGSSWVDVVGWFSSVVPFCWSCGFFFAFLGVVFGVSLILHLVGFFPGPYFLPDTARCNFFGWTMKLSVTFACVIFVSKNLLHNSIRTAAALHQVVCLPGIVSSFGWKGCGRTTLEHSSSNFSSAVSLSFSNLTSVGLDRFPGM